MLLGTFVEELLFPIPSLLVLLPAGVAAEVQGMGLVYLTFLAVLSATGRVLGALVVYWLSDKIEDLALSKGRKLFGYGHADIERLGTRLSGTKRDWWVLFLLNVAPGVPPVVPIACGFLKVDLRMFITTTFFGNIISTGTLLYIGYTGLQIARAFEKAELAWQVVMVIAALVITLWLLIRHMRNRRKTVKQSESVQQESAQGVKVKPRASAGPKRSVKR